MKEATDGRKKVEVEAQEVKDVEEAILQFQNEFLTCILILDWGWGRDARNGWGALKVLVVHRPQWHC